MSSELERRLEAMLAAAPEPEPGVGEEAIRRALRALRPEAAPRRGLRTAVLVLATAVVLLVIAAGSLAAAGALHVSFGAKPKPHPPVTGRLVLPKGANGIAAIVDGRLSVVIKGGFRLQGQRASAAALSPHALYVAAGVGHSLVAMAPDGRLAWSHPAGGTVVAIAWAPDGLQITYVVRRGHGLVLHTIYGNGKQDATIDRSVRAVRPTWRADSLAFAYVGAGGKAIVYDLAHRTHRVAGTAAPVTHLAFAPTGQVLAASTPSSLELVGGIGVGAPVPVIGLGWIGRRLAFAHLDGRLLGTLSGPEIRVPGGTRALYANGRQLAVAVTTGSEIRILAGAPGRLQTVMRLPPHVTVQEIQIG